MLTLTQDNPTFFRDETGKLAAIWPAGLPRDGLCGRLVALVDSERAGSATSILRRFQQAAEAINHDRELSPEGRKKRVASAAEAPFSNLCALASNWRDLQVEHERAKADSVKLPKPDANDVLIDLALAGLVREGKQQTTTALELSGERLRLGIARLPHELSGLGAEAHARIVGSLVNHETALRLEQEMTALDSSHEAIQIALDAVAPHLELSNAQRKAAVGAGFNA